MGLQGAIEDYESMIEVANDNLDYLREYNTAFKAGMMNNWDKLINAIIDLIEDKLGDFLSDLLGDSLDFDTIVSAIKFIAIADPSIFAINLREQIEKIKAFFELERSRILDTIDLLDELIDGLETEWSNITDPEFQKNYKKDLNKYMNSKVPEAGELIRKAKDRLIRMENQIYINQDDSGFADVKTSTKNDLQAAQQLLDDDGSTTSNLMRVINRWALIRNSIHMLSQPGFTKYDSMKSNFNKIGQNFRDSVERMLGILTGIREALTEIETSDTQIYNAWSDSVSHFVKNPQGRSSYSPSNKVMSAIDHYIETGEKTRIQVDFPFIGGYVRPSSYQIWEDKAAVTRLSADNWIKQIDRAIDILDTLTDGAHNDYLDGYDNIYMPIFEEVLKYYQESSNSIWQSINRSMNEIQFIMTQIEKGNGDATELLDRLNSFKNTMNSLRDIITGRLDYFDTETPLDSFDETFGIDDTAQGILNGLIKGADFLGFDQLGELLNIGNFGDVFGLEKEDADTAQALLNNLRETADLTERARTTAFEIIQNVTAESHRKERLQVHLDDILVEAEEKKSEEISKMEENLEILKGEL